MAARAGMSDLNAHVRQLANAGTADATLGDTTYWTDDQLQSNLDRYQTQYRQMALVPQPAYANGNTLYLDYTFPEQEWIERSGEDSGWVMRDADGTAIASGYAINYDARRITFDADTLGSAYYLDYRAYDLYAAVADVWERKAAFVSANVDWSSDNHRVSASQEPKFYEERVMYFRNKSEAHGGMKSIKWIRDDEA